MRKTFFSEEEEGEEEGKEDEEEEELLVVKGMNRGKEGCGVKSQQCGGGRPSEARKAS